jgi:hypothetical protein
MKNMYRAGYAEKPFVLPENYGAGVVTNPRMLPAFVAGRQIFFNDQSGTSVHTETSLPADFDTAAIISTGGANLLTVTGTGGFLHNVISPCGDVAGTAIPTITIVIDGAPYTFATTAALNNNLRFCLGSMANTTAPKLGAKLGKHAQDASSLSLDSLINAMSRGAPRLRFNRSLEVYVQMSAIPATTSTYSNRAMVRWTSD